MINPFIALAAMVLYFLLLFGIGRYAYRQRKLNRSIVSNPYVYALSLCVYATAWAFYGSVGRAASTGFSFLPIYLGPSLIMLLGWLLIKKMILISKEYRLTTISDFISFRYGRSYAIGAMVTIASLIVITPYVALQLIAISESLTIISGEAEIMRLSRLLVAVLLGLLAITFGARYLDPMERHEGLIAVVAFESVVKLAVFLIAGIYITYGIFGGYGAIVEGIATSPEHSHLLQQPDYLSWFSLTLMSVFAVMFLPRQFHVAVVENSNENHIRKVMWLFPLYMLLINLFVPAVAWGGLLLGTPGTPDMFVLSIPISHDLNLLAFLVFIGGLSAATAMVLVTSVAVGTMMLNDLEMRHVVPRIGKGRDLPSLILNMKRLNILVVLSLGYLYSLLVEPQSLVDIGLLSFLAACQLAPAALGGLYWNKGTRRGAIAGLVSGFLIWGYTALVPTLIGSGWLPESLIANGPLDIAFLRHTALFGLNLDMWSHAFFWSMFANCLLYVLVSLICKPHMEETAFANCFVDFYRKRPPLMLSERRMIRVGTIDELEGTLARYIGTEKAKEAVDKNLLKTKATREKIDARQLMELRDHLERMLTGSVGPSATRKIVEEEVEVKPVAEVIKDTTPVYKLEQGNVFVIPNKAYEVFTDQITHGVEGLCITRSNPEEIRRQWHFTETPIIRLSDEKGKGEMYISPTNLPLLYVTIKSFVENSKNSIILMDNLEEIIEENVSVVPESEVLDFVYSMENLTRKSHTRLVLKVRPEFVCRTKLTCDITEVKQLLFLLGPLSSYLFKVLANAMLDNLDEVHRKEALNEIKVTMESEKLFEGINCDWHKATGSSESVCDRDVGVSLGIGDKQIITIDPCIWLSRWELFVALRRLSKVIKRINPEFNLKSATEKAMTEYGLKLYELDLYPGTTYVIEEEKPKNSLKLFSEMVHMGAEGLCVSRYHPERLMEKYNLDTNQVIWLTQSSGVVSYRYVDPSNFPRLSSMISEFLDRSKEPLILLEGLGYLITQSNYESVLRFIQSLRDEITVRKAILIIHIDPLSLDTKELHRLESEMEPLKLDNSNAENSELEDEQ